MDVALVYMVAGISSRFGGRVKQFARVGRNGETLMECSLDQALPAGFTKIIFIVGGKTEKLFREKFGDSYKGVPVEYTLQEFDSETRDKPWGTTDALCTIRDVIDCPFVVCNGDDLYGAGAFKVLVNHLKNPDNAGVGVTVGYKLGGVLPETGTVHRGIFDVDDDTYVRGLVETFNIEGGKLEDVGLNENSSCSMNIFGFFPEVISDLSEILENFKEAHKGDRKAECLLPVDVSSLIEKGKLKMKLYSTDEKWYGLTNPEDEENLRAELAGI